MISSILVLASAVSTDPAPASANVPTFTTFCQTQRSSADEEIVRTCRELAALLAKVESRADEEEGKRAAAALECRAFVKTAMAGERFAEIRDFVAALALAGVPEQEGSGSTPEAESLPCAPVTGLSPKDQEAYGKLAQRYEEAKASAETAQSNYHTARNKLVSWQVARSSDAGPFRETPGTICR